MITSLLKRLERQARRIAELEASLDAALLRIDKLTARLILERAIAQEQAEEHRRHREEAAQYRHELVAETSSIAADAIAAQKAAAKVIQDLHDGLSDAERNIIEAIGNKTLRGADIAVKAGYEFNYVRPLLAGFVRRGVLKKAKGGYRLSNACAHIAGTDTAEAWD